MEALVQIALLHLFAVASPGPDFIVVSRQALRYGFIAGIWTSLGISTGILFHILFALTSVNLIFNYQETLFYLISIIAAVYLFFLGVRSIFNKPKDLDVNEMKSSLTINATKSYTTGFITNITNPKALLFLITLYSVISNNLTLNLAIASGIYMCVATCIWFIFISKLFSLGKENPIFNKFTPIFEKICGLILIIIAIQILILKINL